MNIKTFHLKNKHGLTCTLTNYGATLMSLEVPDKNGKSVDVVVGLPRAENYDNKDYKRINFCMGATIGRYAGRISGGGFTLNDTFHSLENENGITLHGGKKGFDKQLWKVKEIQETGNPYVLFSLKSNEGDSGFPGNIKVFAKYQLVENSLQITYTATTDAPTVLNITNHSYFNLDGTGSVNGNELFVNSSQILETDEQLVPTGKLLFLKDTPYDYSTPKTLEFNNHYGLDTPFVLNSGEIKASLFSEKSGIKMQVYTNQPAIILFTPKDFSKLDLRNNITFKEFPAICFECQQYPDAPNQPNFPSAILLPNEIYRNELIYAFSNY